MFRPGHLEDLRHGKDCDHSGDHVDAVPEKKQVTGVADHAVDGIHADGGHQQAKAAGSEATKQSPIAECGDKGNAEDREEEPLGRPQCIDQRTGKGNERRQECDADQTTGQ